MNVEGKVAIVTGAGSGIGRASALLLGKKGASVLAADIDEATGTETTKEIASSGGRAQFIRMDATRSGDIEMTIERATQLWGKLDIMVNNAGILTGAPRYPDTPVDQWSKVIDLNLSAVIRGTQLAIHTMRQSGGGVIVNTASIAGLQAWAMDPVYSASKGGVVLFTKALAGLAQSDNIRINCVCPTLVETPLLTEASDQRIKNLIQMTRLKADHIAEAVLRLIEDDSLAGQAMRVLPDEEPSFA